MIDKMRSGAFIHAAHMLSMMATMFPEIEPGHGGRAKVKTKRARAKYRRYRDTRNAMAKESRRRNRF